ncbi:MAG: hypothetical protein ACKVI4_17930, partial [Actinomycetales bacterium]
MPLESPADAAASPPLRAHPRIASGTLNLIAMQGSMRQLLFEHFSVSSVAFLSHKAQQRLPWWISVTHLARRSTLAAALICAQGGGGLGPRVCVASTACVA